MPDTKEYLLCNFIYVKWPRKANMERKKVSQQLTGTGAGNRELLNEHKISFQSGGKVPELDSGR